MRLPTLVLSVPLCWLCAVCGAQALAQTPAAQPSAPPGDRLEQTVETIRHEDAGSRVEEVRIGGETKSITVQPKANVPPYELGGEGGNRNPAAANPDSGKSGASGWKVLGF